MARLARHNSTPQVEPAPPGSVLRWLALLSSSGTLICCALPILLVSLGLGTAVAALTAELPLLITLVEYKAWVFAVSAALLAVAGYSTFRPSRLCPVDPALAAACQRAQRLSARLFWLSLTIWSLGFLMAYLALPVRIWLGE
ncbi:hypothetical protein [Pseudomonas benzenivorans]|uniref:Mercury ion transport protein n=1 Tax=Pseudomonas benzenivorans TaxID=556533 RepID=A0ABY5H9D2_9PSED|nr:hypothetical protein [Pseudomonas benzenivorans]UTW08937.1 hypothetical protein KDW96_06415 [Pseudomonas benzenivorans]